MGRSSIGLNGRGRAQARAVAEALRGTELKTVFASPQERAQETATCIAAPRGLTVSVEPEMAEVWLGRWQGKTFSELQGDPDLPRAFSDPYFVSEAIEPSFEVQKRVVAFVERLRESADGAVLLVSHGDPLRVLLAQYLSIPLTEFRRLVVSTGSISLLRFEPRGPRLLLLNWKPTLDPPLDT